jgi:predicted alpha/beta-fold hydrolase
MRIAAATMTIVSVILVVDASSALRSIRKAERPASRKTDPHLSPVNPISQATSRSKSHCVGYLQQRRDPGDGGQRIHHPWRRGGGPDVCAALVRFAELSWRLALATLLFLSLSTLTSCTARLPSAPDAAPIVMPLPHVAGDVWQSRGHVVHQEPYVDPPLEDRDAVLGEAWRAVYTSVSGVDGGSREVSGAFFVPRGTPPENGWPVISLAHGTTGIGHNCGPSRQADLMLYSPLIKALLGVKYAVALSDYEGLGESGSHPYLEPRTAAFNTIDAVRAMREISSAVSARWVAVGFSQGGQAVWAADELNSYYGNDLQLQGSVALAPPANVTGVADLVRSGSLTADQRALFPLLIVGLAQYNPDLDDHAFLHGSTEAYREQFSHCEPTGSHSENTPQAPNPWRTVVDRLSEANDVKPDTPQDVAKLRDALRRAALPQRPLDKPMLVIIGEDDPVVLPDWVQSAVSRSCALGGRIEYLQMPDTGHVELTWKPAHTVERWMADRFAGAAAPSNCPETQK